MSASFASYEGHGPYEERYEGARDPRGDPPAAGPPSPWAVDAAVPTEQPGPPIYVFSEPVTDWRLAVDEFGRPIPPPPSASPGAAPGRPPQPPASPGPPAPPPGPSAYAQAVPHRPPPAQPPPSTPEPSTTTPATTARPPAGYHEPVVGPALQPPSWPGYDYSTPPPSYPGEAVPPAAGQRAGPPAVPSPDPITAQVVTVDGPTPVPPSAQTVASTLPSVSLPAGVVPASVPVPTGNTGVGLTAVDDSPIDVDGPRSPHPAAPSAAYSAPPTPPPYPTAAPARPTGWEVVVDDARDQGRRAPAPPAVPTDLVVTVEPYGSSNGAVATGPAPAGPEAAGPTVTAGVPAADAVAGGIAAGAGEPVVVAGHPARLAGPAGGDSAAALPPAALSALLTELAATAAAAAEAVGTAIDDVDGVSATGPVALRQSAADAPEVRDGLPADPATPTTGANRIPPAPAAAEGWASREDLAARYVVVREQVDYALAEIALARAAFRRASEDDGPGWPFRDSELDVLRRPAVARALARELAGVERLRVWAQELYSLQEKSR